MPPVDNNYKLRNHLRRASFALILGLVVLFTACDPSQEDAEIEFQQVQLNINNISSDLNSISFTVRAFRADIEHYISWGIVYGLTDSKEEGKEIVFTESPATRKKEVTIDGLTEGTTYYVWAWADTGKETHWSSTCFAIATERIQDPTRLSGIIIGTKYSIDYMTAGQSTTVNTKENAFDGNLETYFASYDKSGTWVGLDLGQKHVITKLGFAPRYSRESASVLAVIEGANKEDFSDALPIYVIKNQMASRKMHYVDINTTRAFRYVRYVTPNEANCNIAELEFYGLPGEGDDSQFYQLTNLPTVVINTEGAKEITSKEEETPSVVYIISEDGKDLLATQDTGVRGRGNASWKFPKKPYRLKFSSKQSPLGAPAKAKKWTLISNYGDKTLMRNILAFEVSRRVGQSYTPFCRPVDLIMNGEYKGTYQLCDQVEAASGRVEAKDGYLIEIDAYASGEEVWFTSLRGIPVTIKHPDEDDITGEQRAFIKDYFNLMEGALHASYFQDEDKGYRKYLDLDSFLRNFIIGEFSGNTDTFWSVYMYKDSGDGKLFTGPAWDYDLAFDNDVRTHPITSLTDYIYCTKGSCASGAKNFVSRIVKDDPTAKARLIELWEEARDKGGLNNLIPYVEQTATLLQESQELNFKRWKILDQKVHENYQALGSYSAEVQIVKSYINKRVKHFDQLVRK